MAMPSRKKPDGTYQDVAHPINVDFREFLEGKIIQEYEKEKINQPV